MSEEKLRKVFNSFDINKNGFIDAGELRPMCEMVGINPDPKAIKDIIHYADLNNDGKISYREFLLAIEKSQK